MTGNGRPVPRLKHEQVARVLENEIRGGSVPFGRQLPGEAALAERFSVSRNTVRAALSELGEAGLIATRSGKGSFVTFDGRPLDVKLGWARALQEQGVDAKAEVLRLEQSTDPELARELGELSDRFIVVDRLRRIESGPPISYERSRIPATPRAVSAFESGLAGGSLTQLLIESGLVAAQGEQWVDVRMLSVEDARLLERAPGEAFLWSRCLTRDSTGALVENVESLLDPAHFRLHFSFSAS
ncbi:MAG TPA: GntR family transcriptional regulator [Microbacteriaceae bacterium]|jgi:GntR family transcriptional regulator|nr:GntR family transcriptional regulator [Microbacteriaceae bacterium]